MTPSYPHDVGVKRYRLMPFWAILTAAAKAEEAATFLLRLGGRVQTAEQADTPESGAAALAA